MLIRRLSLYCAALVLLCPVMAKADSLLSKKRSNLPCLVGQPSFSDHLIANNPWRSGKAYLVSDSLSWFAMGIIKFPSGSFTLNELKEMKFPEFDRWQESADHIVTKINSVGTLIPILESAVHLGRFATVYGSSAKGTFALVAGNSNEPFGCHFSLGRFPIHFGTNFSEYSSFANPLLSDLGAAANVSAASINFGYHWNPKHETKIRVFGFIGDSVDILKVGQTPHKKNEKVGQTPHKKNEYVGMSLNHDWSFNVGSISLGMSWVNGLPIKAVKSSEIKEKVSKKSEKSKRGDQLPERHGLDVYLHATAGSFRLKLEGIKTGLEEFVRFFKQEITTKDLTEWVGHAELSYRLPLKRESSVVFGYTQGCSNLVAAKYRVFGGFKVNLYENMQCLLGYQCEQRLKKFSQYPYANLISNAHRYDELRHSVTFQINYIL